MEPILIGSGERGLGAWTSRDETSSMRAYTLGLRISARVRRRVTRLEFDAVRGLSFNAIAQRVCAIWVRARGVKLPFSQDAIAVQVVHDLCADNGFFLGGVSGFGVRRT